MHNPAKILPFAFKSVSGELDFLAFYLFLFYCRMSIPFLVELELNNCLGFRLLTKHVCN